MHDTCKGGKDKGACRCFSAIVAFSVLTSASRVLYVHTDGGSKRCFQLKFCQRSQSWSYTSTPQVGSRSTASLTLQQVCSTPSDLQHPVLHHKRVQRGCLVHAGGWRTSAAELRPELRRCPAVTVLPAWAHACRRARHTQPTASSIQQCSHLL